MLERLGLAYGHVSGMVYLDFEGEALEEVFGGFGAYVSGELEITDEERAFMQQTQQAVQARYEAIQSGAEDIPELTSAQRAAFGTMAAMRSGLREMRLEDAEIQQVIDGLRKAYDVGPEEIDVQAMLPEINAFMTQRRAALANEANQQVAAANQAFFDQIEQEEGVQEDPAGFYYKVVEPGEGEKPGPEDRVQVHYRGTLIDGSVFDSSYDRGSPATFSMGGVIPGFSGGLSKIAPGGEMVIYIPPELGYGSRARPGIPANSVLIFECELLAVNP